MSGEGYVILSTDERQASNEVQVLTQFGVRHPDGTVVWARIDAGRVETDQYVTAKSHGGSESPTNYFIHAGKDHLTGHNNYQRYVAAIMRQLAGLNAAVDEDDFQRVRRTITVVYGEVL